MTDVNPEVQSGALEHVHDAETSVARVVGQFALTAEDGQWRNLPATTDAAGRLIAAVVQDFDIEIVDASPSRREDLAAQRDRIVKAAPAIVTMAQRGDLPDAGETYDMIDFVAEGRVNRQPPQLRHSSSDRAAIQIPQIRRIFARYAEQDQFLPVADLAAFQEAADTLGLSLEETDLLAHSLDLDLKQDDDRELLERLVENAVSQGDHESVTEAILRESEFRSLGDQANL